MKHFQIFVFSTTALVASVAVGFAQRTAAPMATLSVLEAEQHAGQQVFKDHCASCHTLKSGAQTTFGPNLSGVVGRRAASVPGFPYSDALKKSGLTWDEDTLRRWMNSNEHIVPNTLVPHVGISDPAEQIYVVEYLKTLKALQAR